jgi:ribonuclease HI
VNPRRQRADPRKPRPSGSDRPVTIYTDGACLGNPGPGGWAAIVIEGGQERELSGAEPTSTNQRMELTAAIEGLRALAAPRRVDFYSDSAYLVNCFRDGWYQTWQRNGWKNAQRKPVDNRDLWEALIALAERHQVSWHKVRGHSGDPLNERADRLARAAIERPRAPVV